MSRDLLRPVPGFNDYSKRRDSFFPGTENNSHDLSKTFWYFATFLKNDSKIRSCGNVENLILKRRTLTALEKFRQSQ